MTQAKVLAEHAASLKFEDLTEECIEKAKLLLLDQLGCQIAFAAMPWGKSVYRYTTAKHGQGTSSIVHYGGTTCAEDAAFCNSVFGHGFEMDDCDMDTTSHPAVAIIPAVMAVAEQEAASGKDVLTAMVTGYETMIRFGLGALSMRYRFWHATAVSGAFGAAAATGWLLGFDADTMREALAIASYECCGNSEYTCSGGTSKRLLGAVATRAGIQSAYLAQAGITGPGRPFDGNSCTVRGICDSEPDFDQFTRPFVGDFLTPGVGTKPYCCCAGMHTCVDAADNIRNMGIDYHDIDKIVVTMRPREIMSLSRIEIPETEIEAQFCVRFAVALRLVKGGNGFYDYTLENVQNPDIIELMKKTEYASDDDGTVLAKGDSPMQVEVTMKDGTVITENVPYAKGTKQIPMSKDELIEKFKGLVSRSMPESKANQIVAAIMNIEKLETITPLTSLLVAEMNIDMP